MLNQKGVSFVETILYIAIISLVMTAFFNFSLSNNTVYTKTYMAEDVHSNLRYALSVMSKRIRAANSVNTAQSNLGGDPGTLSLAMSDSLYNPTIFNLNHDDGALYLTEGLGYPVALTTQDIYISKLIFNYLEDHGQEAVQIEITGERRGSSQEYNYTESVQTAVALR